jgi:hypothetical protein
MMLKHLIDISTNEEKWLFQSNSARNLARNEYAWEPRLNDYYEAIKQLR